MDKLSPRKLKILHILRENPGLASSRVFELVKISESVSLVTIKRELSMLEKASFLEKTGQGSNIRYRITIAGRLFLPFEPSLYILKEPDSRHALRKYDFHFFERCPISFFSKNQIGQLQEKSKLYKARASRMSELSNQKEIERFVIELSWKSSKIEGNTYTLLDTERLLKDGIAAKGHSSDEATMIINHKKAFNFILDHIASAKNPSWQFIEELHKILIKGLAVRAGIRTGLVGITGSSYLPLDNKFQIKEAINSYVKAMNRTHDVYSKGLLAIVGLSYIQPFEDGNKRAARMLGNAILLANRLAPLSYRSVSEEAYRNALLVFYEQLSILAFQQIFIEQYIFSAENYAVTFV